VLCLKTAVYELTGGDEHAAELIVAAPVDEMVHAVLAQHTLCVRMTTRLGIRFVHMTDRERFGYRKGEYTYRAYVAAGWGEPNERLQVITYAGCGSDSTTIRSPRPSPSPVNAFASRFAFSSSSR
jgi:hypothetical protein